MDTAQTEKIRRGRLSAEGTYGPRRRYMYSGTTARRDLSAKLKESNRKEVQLDLSLLGGMEQDADEQEIRPWWRLIERIRDQAERNAATPTFQRAKSGFWPKQLRRVTGDNHNPDVKRASKLQQAIQRIKHKFNIPENEVGRRELTAGFKRSDLYFKGAVYVIYCKQKYKSRLYVGETIQSTWSRFQQHFTDGRRKHLLEQRDDSLIGTLMGQSEVKHFGVIVSETSSKRR